MILTYFLSFSHCSVLSCILFNLPSFAKCKYFLKTLLWLVEMFTKIQCSVLLFVALNIKSPSPSFVLFSVDLPVLLASHLFIFLKSLKATLYDLTCPLSLFASAYNRI